MSKEIHQVSEKMAAAILSAIGRLIRPLVRLMIASGITYPTLIRLLKTVYVDVADRHFQIDGKAQTDSRISLITGVHRKDVKRIRAEDAEDDTVGRTVSLGSQIVARWLGDARYIDDQGRALPLNRYHQEQQPSFEELVSSVSKDIRPRAVLDEWVRLGVATLDADNRVWLNEEAFVPQKGYKEKAWYFGKNVGAHVATATHNLLGEGQPMLERGVHYNRLTAESVEMLEQLARDRGLETLKEVNRLAMARQKVDKNNPEARHRMHFGVYFYRGESENKGDNNKNEA